MPSFRSATVTGILAARPGLTRVAVAVHGGGPARAYAVVALTGPVAVGDDVVLNTTAVELGLGTGGWHVVHWNLSRGADVPPGPGHIMKLRYTSLQVDTGAAEELRADELEGADLAGVPVVAIGLHSQLPAVAATLAHARPGVRVAYVMTDGASLPLALSELVPALRDTGLLVGTVTAGHAFGGDHEAVNVPSGLLVAHRLLAADVVVVGMGPGSLGTGTRLGFSALEVGPALDAADALGGRAVATCRFSLADGRPRHQGVSHHFTTALTVATGVTARHDVVAVADPGVPDLLAGHGLTVTTMGRGPSDDPGAFAVAGAAGTLAASLL